MIRQFGLGRTRTASRLLAGLACISVCFSGVHFPAVAQDSAVVQPLDSASAAAAPSASVEPAQPGAPAQASRAARQPAAAEVEEQAPTREKRGIFSGSGKEKRQRDPREGKIDPKTGKRYLPTFEFDPTQVNEAGPRSEYGAPTDMVGPNGGSLQQFTPTGPPGGGVRPAAEPAPKPKQPKPKPVAAAAPKGETAFNPKFGALRFDPGAMDDGTAVPGELATETTNLKQFTPTGPPDVDAKPKPAKPQDAGSSADAMLAADSAKKRQQADWMTSEGRRPLPSFQPKVEDAPVSGEDPTLASLTQFEPTGPAPDLDGAAAAEKRANRQPEQPKVDLNAQKRAQFAKYYESEIKKPLPSLEVEFAQPSSAMIADVGAADPNYTELAMGPTIAGRQLNHFEADPPEVPIQLRPASTKPIDKRGRGVDQAPIDNSRKYQEYYAMDTKFPMPRLETPAEVWTEGDKVYITGAPKTARGRPMTPFGNASAPGVEAQDRGLLPGHRYIDVDVSAIAEAEVAPAEPVPVAEVAAADPNVVPTQVPDEITGNDLDPSGWPIPETPVEKLAARSIFAVAQRIAGAEPVVGQPSLFPAELTPGGVGPDGMPDGDLNLPDEQVGPPELDDSPIIPELRGIELASTWRQREEALAAAAGEEASIDPGTGTATDGAMVAEVTPPDHSLFSDNLTIDEDLEVPDDVQQMFAEHIGQPLSLSSLDEMLRKAIAGYQGSDLPVVDISIPEQEITDGILKLDVLEARLGRSLVEDATSGGPPEYSEPEYMMAQIRTESGEKLRSSELLDDVAWLNRYPFRRVDLIYTPGEEFGETDIILRTIERKPWLFYTGIDNTGSELLGDYRATASLTVGSPFGHQDHLMAYAYSADTDFEHLQSHSLAYTLPVYWNHIRQERHERHMLTILGAFADVGADQTIDGQLLSLEGFSGQASLNYLIPMDRKPGVTRDLVFGIDWKASNNNLQFNTLEVFDTTTHIYQISGGFNSRYEEFLGLMGFASVDVDLVFSPGGLTGENSDTIFESARAGAEAQYAYARGTFQWNVPLNDWELVARLTGQMASTNLLATEQLGAGGMDDVRGFEERIARGDSGAVGGIELRSPSLEVPSFVNFRGEQLPESWQGVLFYDAAMLTNVHKVEGEPDWFTLQSTGVGLRYEFNNTFTFEVDYGWVIDASGLEVEDGGRLHVRGRITR